MGVRVLIFLSITGSRLEVGGGGVGGRNQGLSVPTCSSCTASVASDRLLLRSLNMIGFRDVTEINLGASDRAQGE